MRREVVITGSTEITLSINPEEYSGLTLKQICEILKSHAETCTGRPNISDDDVELAAYQIRADLM